MSYVCVERARESEAEIGSGTGTERTRPTR